MRKVAIILVSFLGLQTTTHAAPPKWTKVADNGYGTLYIDTETVVRDGGDILIWQLDDYSKEQELAHQIKYKSMVLRERINCKLGTAQNLAMLIYSQNMGQGDPVVSFEEPGKVTHIAPGTAVATLHDALCK